MASRYKRENARRVALSMPRSHGRFVKRSSVEFTRQGIDELEQRIYKAMLNTVVTETRDRLERVKMELVRCIDELDQMTETLADIQKVTN